MSQCHPARRPQHPERHIENEPKLNSKSVRLISHPPLPYYRTSGFRPQGLKLQAQASVTNLSVVHTRIHTPRSLPFPLLKTKSCQVLRSSGSTTTRLEAGLGDRLGTRLPDLKLSRSSRGFICRVCTSPNPRLSSTILPAMSRRVALLFHDGVRPRP